MRKLFYSILLVLLTFALQDAAFAQAGHIPIPSAAQMACKVRIVISGAKAAVAIGELQVFNIPNDNRW